ncbi:hypothetical protein [Streptomyces albipurpureus]|uniref:Secreted protein n=1 Tax=Streptomyces albipurpureus TaxID=2897419 RepID=A0ABT0UK09_9ACTN|nr:hypothetical protein [Streptomyces sp. CWNU-1]MCM2388963.1 hypothetical protein [Streptomyces sp. CWNU-1]
MLSLVSRSCAAQADSAQADSAYTRTGNGTRTHTRTGNGTRTHTRTGNITRTWSAQCHAESTKARAIADSGLRHRSARRCRSHRHYAMGSAATGEDES